jgi:hypothetical protein
LARVVALRRPGIAVTDLERVPTAIVQIASIEEPADGAPERLDALGRRGAQQDLEGGEDLARSGSGQDCRGGR